LRITIDVFSGRENPVVEFSGAQLGKVVERLTPVESVGRSVAALPPVPTLGYRGLLVEQVGTPIRGLPRAFRVADGFAIGPESASRIADDGFEEFIAGSVREDLPRGRLVESVGEFRKLADHWRHSRWEDRCCDKPKRRKHRCRCAPLYEPGWWNVPARQPHNNCYNYGTNYRTDTFAQPGRAAGDQYHSITCPEVRAAAIRDQLIDSPGADNKCPEEGHLVALVVGPGWDYHWYRKGRDGLWTHKPGGTAVTNLDNSGNTIPDPRTADRGWCTDFCTFMIVMHGHIKIS
jgi:hypothetical protein